MGLKIILLKKWMGRDDTPCIRDIVYEYIGGANVDLKQKCLEIQKDFGSFVKFINQKIKNK
jgi:hypothetical protein